MSMLADMLVDAGLSRDHLEECRRLAAETGESLDRVILRRDYLPEREVLRVYAQHLGFEYRDSLEDAAVPSAFVRLRLCAVSGRTLRLRGPHVLRIRTNT